MLSRKRIIAATDVHKEPEFTISERTEAFASFVQQRIWLHDQLYSHSSDLVLHTAVRFNPQSNQIEQYIQAATDEIYSFQHSRGINTSEELDRLLTKESIGKFFDFEKGKVLRCHIVQRQDNNNADADGLLYDNDIIALSFHHIEFDNSSLMPFIKAFKQIDLANKQQSILSVPQYIDFAL
ncbi:unnamed protein product [Adineta steineri]|uniref:Condensation domain-containing protein n=1 Tax=Adineta steineri TaxID=433720 RepID=A0A815AL80_9BILA|nr:unnamed protein product [Adineta steineri]CAF1345764.1 unnamed protein product [Adineta steineri]